MTYISNYLSAEVFSYFQIFTLLTWFHKAYVKWMYRRIISREFEYGLF